VNTALMFSKASDLWTTPPDLYRALDLEFRFQFDAAALTETSTCGASYYGPDRLDVRCRDALTVEWPTGLRFFLNPPHSLLGAFIAKAAAEAQHGALVVMLIPARTDTKAFHRYIWDDVRHQPRDGVEVRFLRGRLKFGSATNSAPFPSAVIVFRPR
jgi:site-specific DNA-methyltransferase (adenine-specific)